MNVLRFHPAVAGPRAPMFPCPVQEGCRIRYGLKKWFWRTVAAVGEPVKLANGWLAPVLYRSGVYGLVYHRFPEPGKELYDSVADVRPNTFFTRALLRMPISMPQLLPDAPEGAIALSVDHTDEKEGDQGEMQQKKVYLLHLYGVIAERKGRKDSPEFYNVAVPTRFAHKWA